MGEMKTSILMGCICLLTITGCQTVPARKQHNIPDHVSLKNMADAIVEEIGGRKGANCEIVSAVYQDAENVDVEIVCDTDENFSYQCLFEAYDRRCIQGGKIHKFKFYGFVESSVKGHRAAYFYHFRDGDPEIDVCSQEIKGFHFFEFSGGWHWYYGYKDIRLKPNQDCFIIV